MRFDLGAPLFVATMALSASALTAYAVSDARSLGSGRKPAPGARKEAGALVDAWVRTGFMPEAMIRERRQ